MKTSNKIQPLYILIICVFISCCRKDIHQNDIQIIDVEKNVNNLKVLNMSQFVSNIQYISLENVDDVPLTAFSDFDISDKFILKTDMNFCVLFNNSGKLVEKFGKRGRGPNEYLYAANLNLCNDSIVFFKSSGDLFEYSITGRFINSYKDTFKFNGKYYISMFFPINDSLFICQVPNYTGKAEYKSLIINKKGEIKYAYYNYITFNRTNPVILTPEFAAYFHRFNNEIFFNDRYNDTLFVLDDNYQLKPKYVFNLGNFKEPIVKRQNPDNSVDQANYIVVKWVTQTDNYLFFCCDFGLLFPKDEWNSANKVASDKSSYRTTNCLGVYDKMSSELSFCKPTSSNNLLSYTGLYNDIDGGPKFFPQENVNDSTIVMWIDPKQLKDHINSNEFITSNPIFPDKKLKLQELASKISDFDNPILMKVTFKN